MQTDQPMTPAQRATLNLVRLEWQLEEGAVAAPWDTSLSVWVYLGPVIGPIWIMPEGRIRNWDEGGVIL